MATNEARTTARSRTTTSAGRARATPAADTSPGPAGRSIGQWLTLAMGIVFLAVGIAGFVQTGFDDFAAHDTGETVLGFEVNPLHNIVHLLFGVLGVTMWTRPAASRVYGVLLVVGYGGALVYGLVALGEDWDVLSLNQADNWLHAGLALVGLPIIVLSRRPGETIDLR